MSLLKRNIGVLIIIMATAGCRDVAGDNGEGAETDTETSTSFGPNINIGLVRRFGHRGRRTGVKQLSYGSGFILMSMHK